MAVTGLLRASYSMSWIRCSIRSNTRSFPGRFGTFFIRRRISLIELVPERPELLTSFSTFSPRTLLMSLFRVGWLRRSFTRFCMLFLFMFLLSSLHLLLKDGGGGGAGPRGGTLTSGGIAAPGTFPVAKPSTLLAKFLAILETSSGVVALLRRSFIAWTHGADTPVATNWFRPLRTSDLLFAVRAILAIPENAPIIPLMLKGDFFIGVLDQVARAPLVEAAAWAARAAAETDAPPARNFL